MNDKIIEDFWDEYEAYSLQKFRKNGYHYETSSLESAVLRVNNKYSKKAFINGILIGAIIIVIFLIIVFEIISV